MKSYSTGIRNSVRALILVMCAAVPGSRSGHCQTTLDLSQAVETALDANYGIRIIEKSVEIAETNNSWGTAGRLPTIGFSLASNNRADFSEDSDVTTNTLTPGVSLNWTIFSGYAVSVTKEKLETLESLSKGNAAVVVEQTVQRVIMAYYQALLEKEKLAVLEEVMNLSSDRYNYVQAQKDIGSAVTYDVLQAKNAWLEDKADFIAQKVTCDNAVRDLNFIMGVRDDRKYVFTDSFDAPLLSYAFEDLEAKMLSNNKTLKNQYLNEVLNEKEIALAKSQFYPTLSLRTGVDAAGTRTKVDSRDASTRQTQDAFLNLTLSYSLFDGGARKRAMRIAAIEDEIGRVETDEMVHSLTNELTKQLNLYSVRKDLLAVAEENLAAARLNLEISEEHFRNGTISSFNFRDVQLIYLRASLNNLNAVYNLIDSDTELARLTGGIVTEK